MGVKNKEIDAIIFDLDGTLWDTVDSCLKAATYIKNKYKDITEKVTKEQIESCMGKTFDEVVNIYYGYLSKEKAIKYTKETLNKEIEYLLKEGGTLYPNTKKTILELSKKYKLYIVSNCVEGYIESFLKSSGLNDYFNDYESAGRTGLTKGENIKLVIKRNNLKNAIYVGDTIKDEKASYYAGIPFVYANYGFGKVDKYDYKINDISELLNL